LPAEAAAGLVLFGSKAGTVQTLGTLNEEHRRQFVGEHCRLFAMQTPKASGSRVDAALDELRSRSRAGSVSLIVLLTDGGIDTGSKARDAEIQHLMETQVLAEVRKQKTRIYPIAFTTDADVSLFQKIARGSGGECYLALSPDELESVFGRLATAIAKLGKRLPAGPSTAVETTEPPEDLKPSVTSTPAAPAGVSKIWLAIGLVALLGLAGWGYFVLKPKLTGFYRRDPCPKRPSQTCVRGSPFESTKTVIQIGRKADNDLVIAELDRFGTTCENSLPEGKVLSADLQSANETKVNGQKVEADGIAHR
jgi:hypothetical protein